ncbi:CDP-alcohol phosphatidyltransferase family protein [Sphingomonas sp. A2-49]|uniref:CDP-alcohol phosphatidyltransferase family protein n=1 Tax=Sphingomonas sp. A2-49 TaxID=1391375 RepID=UPI0021D24BE6|nr:CDP-alcohol phosphatidyltransferase family protein [Sphingomonas sp. A2-49]MCU6454722.1 CDP-alcohol phosphatidyltransferase family protein [Sphingomonas sp. A2-49]
MTPPPRDGSRDRRIEDPSNLYLIHPASHALLPYALKAGVSANAVSVIGLGCGTVAALAYADWHHPAMALVGLVFSVAWLVADGLDGMIARATRTASALGRTLDGLCDHGVFALIYVALAWTVGTTEGWVLAIAAAACHAVQSSLYEGERARFHRRARGVALTAVPTPTGMILVRLYDSVAGSVDRISMPFERRFGAAEDRDGFAAAYAAAAVPVMRLQSLLTANVRVWAICIACLAGNPRIFWWFEIVPLTAIVAVGLYAHRRVERRFVHGLAPHSILYPSEQGHS